MCSIEKKIFVIMYFVAIITIVSLMIMFLVDVVSNKNKLDYLNSITDPTQLDCSKGCPDLYAYSSALYPNKCCDQYGYYCMLKSKCLSNEIDSSNNLETMAFNSFITTLIIFLSLMVIGVVLFIIRVRRHGYPQSCIKFARFIRERFGSRSNNADNIPFLNQEDQHQDIRQQPIFIERARVSNERKSKLQSQYYSDPNQDCSICLMPFQYQKSIKLKCSHLFHSPCIRLWLAVLINLKPSMTSFDSISVVAKNESDAVEGVITSYSDLKPLFWFMTEQQNSKQIIIYHG